MPTQTQKDQKATAARKPRGRKPAAPKTSAAAAPPPKPTTINDIAGDVLTALDANGVVFHTLTEEQRARAASPPAGLGTDTGKSLTVYVLEGKTARQQADEAKAEREKRDGVRAPREARGPREGSALHAAVKVLEAADEPLTPQEIYDRAKKRRLVSGLKGKTPVATLAAQLAVQNKKGLLVERPVPGRYQLRQMPAAGDGDVATRKAA